MRANKVSLKPEARHQPRRVMATGVFDLLHPGHIYYLEQSKKLGDELVVVVANDTVVARTKGKPLFEADSRKQLVAALACVDRVIIPVETDPRRFYRTVLDIDPDIITLGYDQIFTEQTLVDELARFGWKGQVVRIDKYPEAEISSSKLKNRLKKS